MDQKKLTQQIWGRIMTKDDRVKYLVDRFFLDVAAAEEIVCDRIEDLPDEIKKQIAWRNTEILNQEIAEAQTEPKEIIRIAHSQKVKYCGAAEKVAIGLEGLAELIGTASVTKGKQLDLAIESVQSIKRLLAEMNAEIEIAN